MSAVGYERDGDVGVVTISHPPLNLFGAEIVEGLESALDEAGDVRALVIRAEGQVFTGGVDVNVFDGMTPDQAQEFAGRLLPLVHKLEDKPY